MNKFIKDQISQLKPSATLVINEESNRLKKNGKKIYKFGFGQSPFPIPESVVSALKTNANKHIYLQMQGLEELRSAIANQLNQSNNNDFVAEDIIVGPGTKELMFLTQIVFAGEILLPAPSWVSYQPQAFIAKNKVHWIQTTSNSNWFPTAKQLENKIKDKIKKTIRTNASPRHVPSKIISILEIPKTKNGKLVELAVKQSVEGYKIKNLEALANPDSLKQFKNIKELNE